LKIRSGVVCRSGDIAQWEKTLGLFRLFTIKGDSLSYSPPLRFCKDPTAPHDELTLNLTLTFRKDNSGNARSNEALLTNRFDVDLPGCRVRFIMPKSENGYRVSGGEIFQTIENDSLTVVDVSVDLPAESSETIEIEPVDTGCDVFLLIGQSNMAGRGALTARDTLPMENVLLLDPQGVPEQASNPLNKHSSIRKSLDIQRMGPGYSFARTLSRRTGRKVLMVVNARGGTTIEEWAPGSQFYRQAVLRAVQAMRHGELKAILWHQGEGNSSDPSQYMDSLMALVSSIRKDLNAPDLPFIAGEIADWHRNAGKFNPVINTITDRIPFSDCVSSRGATPLIDENDPHFSREGQLLLGERYAAKVIEMCYRRNEAE
jgi:hypothetical protein